MAAHHHHLGPLLGLLLLAAISPPPAALAATAAIQSMDPYLISVQANNTFDNPTLPFYRVYFQNKMSKDVALDCEAFSFEGRSPTDDDGDFVHGFEWSFKARDPVALGYDIPHIRPRMRFRVQCDITNGLARLRKYVLFQSRSRDRRGCALKLGGCTYKFQHGELWRQDMSGVAGQEFQLVGSLPDCNRRRQPNVIDSGFGDPYRSCPPAS